jgi:hypothetical protein
VVTLISAEVHTNSWDAHYGPPSCSGGDTGFPAEDLSVQILLQSRKMFQTEMLAAKELDCSLKRM